MRLTDRRDPNPPDPVEDEWEVTLSGEDSLDIPTESANYTATVKKNGSTVSSSDITFQWSTIGGIDIKSSSDGLCVVSVPSTSQAGTATLSVSVSSDGKQVATGSKSLTLVAAAPPGDTYTVSLANLNSPYAPNNTVYPGLAIKLDPSIRKNGSYVALVDYNVVYTVSGGTLKVINGYSSSEKYITALDDANYAESTVTCHVYSKDDDSTELCETSITVTNYAQGYGRLSPVAYKSGTNERIYYSTVLDSNKSTPITFDVGFVYNSYGNSISDTTEKSAQVDLVKIYNDVTSTDPEGVSSSMVDGINVISVTITADSDYSATARLDETINLTQKTDPSYNVSDSVQVGFVFTGE